MREEGFTLIELLTSMAIAAIIVGALGALMMGSFRTLAVLDGRKGAALEGAAIAVEKMAREVQSSPVYPDIPFKGKSTELEFPELVPVSTKGAINADFRLGQVQTAVLGQNFAFKPVDYYYDEAAHALMRKIGDEPPVTLVPHIDQFALSYGYISLKDGGFEWASETGEPDPQKTLRAVSVHLRFDKNEYQYTIPGVERTFLVAREHPVARTVIQEKAR